MKRKIAALTLSLLMGVCALPVHASSPGWKQDHNGWWYDNGDGSYARNELRYIDGEYYYFDDDGYMATGWRTTGGVTLYFKSSGAMACSQWVGKNNNEWVDRYGWRLEDSWVDNGRYYVDGAGFWDPSKGTRKTAWKHDAGGWWFEISGMAPGYARNEFMEIDGEMYYFNNSGYMVTGWQKLFDYWAYFGSDGAMRHDQWIGNYYVGTFGQMLTGTWVGEYYVGEDGAWVRNPGTPSWVQDGGGWKYDYSGYGEYVRSNFRQIGDDTYAFGPDGYMRTGWIYFAGSWFFFKDSGAMKFSAWEGDYWLRENGTMATDQWVDHGRYYVDETGKWVPDAKKS